MIGKMLTKIGIIGVLAFCYLLQVDLAGGDDGIYKQIKKKCNAPMEIELYFSSTPMLNEYTVLNIGIKALKDAPNTLIEIELPGDGFELISGNTQLNEDLTSGSTTIYQLEVFPVALGQYKIAASATSEEIDYIFGKREELYVNIGEGFSKLSKSSFSPEIADNRSRAVKIGSSSEPPTQVLPDHKPAKGQEISYFAAPGAGEIVVSGYWFYQDRSGIDRPLRDAMVEIWDSGLSSDTLLDTTYTNNSGYYASGNISNSDGEGGQDIYVKVFSSDNRSVRVTDFSTPSNLYYSVTPVQNDVSDGDVDMGSYSLDDVNNRMAWYIYDVIANDAFDYLAVNVGWENLYKLQVRWSPTNTNVGTYYRPGGSIDLLAGDRWDSDVFLHEYGHFVMYKIYGDYIPPSPNCYSHYWGGHSSLGCAWTEGWANFLQGAIQNDRFYDDTEDQILHINFEPPTPSADQADDEGAVAASLWDIFDPTSTSESWDAIGNGINGSSNNGIWSIAYSDGPTDFLEFYSYWINSSNGYNPEITTILQHHQIDPDTTLPTVTIAAPTSGSTYSTGNSQLSISGTASDNVAVTLVSWSNSRGGSGTCSGTSTWSKNGIVLSSGQNVIAVTARDAAGNTGTDTLTVTYTPPDTTLPTVTIAAPTSGSTYSTGNSQLSIDGTASDNVAVTLVSWSNSRGGSGTCSGTSTWSKNGIVLSSGQNVIAVTARDAAGNTGTDTLTVTYTPPDTTLPTVTIAAPTSGSTYSTGNSQLSISGTASDNVAVTLVSWSNSRGGSGTCSGTSTWSKNGIVLSSGQNVITVTARDAAGNTGTDTLTVTYTPPDTTLPTVTIAAPTSGSTYSTGNSQLSISGTASDNVVVTLVNWSNSRGGSGTCSGTSTWSKNGIVLSSGQNVIAVTARDAAGNTGTDTLTVTYTPPDTTLPTVTIAAPTSGSTYSTGNSQLSISGTASDNVAVTSVSWSNSRGGSGTCSGTSTWSKNGIVLSSGQNVITVTARDAAGNTGTDTLTVTYTPPDTTLPTVTIAAPTSGSTYSTGNSQLSISGTASDNVAVTLVSWSNSRGGSGTCSGTSTWSKNGIVLSSGQNVITVTARDAAGNTGTDTLTVTYTPPDTTLPTVTIAAPTSGSTYSTGNSQLSISGTASNNVAVTLVSWSNSRGGSGTCSGTSTWSKNGIVLSSGQNVITVTARDAAGNTGTDTLTVTYTPPDTTLPTVTIAAPTSGSTYSTGNSQLSISGTASDNVAVTLVSWSNSRGGSGTCSGTSTWSKNGIVLSSGQNVITVTARDAAGNTGTDTLTVTYTPSDTPPEIIEEDSYPHDAQGMDDGTLRVPIDTSIVIRLKNDDGIDQDSLEMRIENQPVDIRVQEVNDGDDTDCWIIHSSNTPFAFEQAVNFTIDAKSLNGVEMDTYHSSFKIESQEEHDAALANTPSNTDYFNDPVIGQNTVTADPGTAIEGAEIIYDNLEPAAPRFGPLEEVPNLDIVKGVGLPLNLQPANVFVKPVTVFIPCPGETDLGILEIYVFKSAKGWQASWETDGCIVPGSRVNHGPNDPDPTEPPTIEVQLNHFSGVQAGKPAELIFPSSGAGDKAGKGEGGGGGGGGGACFISAAAWKMQQKKGL